MCVDTSNKVNFCNVIGLRRMKLFTRDKTRPTGFQQSYFNVMPYNNFFSIFFINILLVWYSFFVGWNFMFPFTCRSHLFCMWFFQIICGYQFYFMVSFNATVVPATQLSYIFAAKLTSNEKTSWMPNLPKNTYIHHLS